MSFVLPWDGVYHIRSAAHFKQKIGIKDDIVAGRHEDSVDPHIEVSSRTYVPLHHHSVLMDFCSGKSKPPVWATTAK